MLGNKLVVLLCVANAILSISCDLIQVVGKQKTSDFITHGIHSQDKIISWQPQMHDLTPAISYSSDHIFPMGMISSSSNQGQMDRLPEHVNSQGTEPLLHSSATVQQIDHKPAECACSHAWDKFVPFCIVCVGFIATFICIKSIILVVKAVIPVWGMLCHRDRSEERYTTSNKLASGTELNAKADIEKGAGEK